MKISSDLKKALQRARTALETRDRIRASLAAAVQLQPQTEQRLQTALEDLGEVEATAALEGLAAPGSARDNLADARLTVDVLAARISGLAKKLELHQAELLAAGDELAVAREKFNADVLAEYGERLETAAAEFTAVLRCGAALADAIGAAPIEAVIRSISVQNPMFADESLISMDVRDRVGRERLPIPIWQGDVAAEAAYKAHAEAFTVAGALKRAVQEAVAAE